MLIDYLNFFKNKISALKEAHKENINFYNPELSKNNKGVSVEYSIVGKGDKSIFSNVHPSLLNENAEKVLSDIRSIVTEANKDLIKKEKESQKGLTNISSFILPVENIIYKEGFVAFDGHNVETNKVVFKYKVLKNYALNECEIRETALTHTWNQDTEQHKAARDEMSYHLHEMLSNLQYPIPYVNNCSEEVQNYKQLSKNEMAEWMARENIKLAQDNSFIQLATLRNDLNNLATTHRNKILLIKAAEYNNGVLKITVSDSKNLLSNKKYFFKKEDPNSIRQAVETIVSSRKQGISHDSFYMTFTDPKVNNRDF